MLCLFANHWVPEALLCMQLHRGGCLLVFNSVWYFNFMKTFCFQTLRSCFLPNGLPNGCISEVFMNISLLMKIDLLTHLEVINGWDHKRKHLQLNTGKSGKSISDTILWDCLSQQAQASDLFGVRIKTTNSSSIHLSCLYWRLNLRSGTERKLFRSHTFLIAVGVEFCQG